MRNWDSCAFSVFTVHASGHNPRPRQWNRYRQRIYHKFIYYPDKFGRILCTGCGRCVEACPAGLDLIEVLADLAAREGARS
jgi:ferredoxin